MRTLIVSVEDTFTRRDPAYASRVRSVVALAVGWPEHVLQEAVLTELRDRAAKALRTAVLGDASIVCFAGADAVERARSEVKSHDNRGLPVKIQSLNLGELINVPTPDGNDGAVPAHCVRVIDGPKGDEVVVALRAITTSGA